MSRGILPSILSDFQHGNTNIGHTVLFGPPLWQGYVSIWGIRAPECQPRRAQLASVCGVAAPRCHRWRVATVPTGADCAKACRAPALKRMLFLGPVVLINPKVRSFKRNGHPLQTGTRAQCCVPISDMKAAKLQSNLRTLGGSYSRIPRDSVWYDRVIYVPENGLLNLSRRSLFPPPILNGNSRNHQIDLLYLTTHRLRLHLIPILLVRRKVKG